MRVVKIALKMTTLAVLAGALAVSMPALTDEPSLTRRNRLIPATLPTARLRPAT